MTVHDLQGRPNHDRGLELAAMAVDFELTRAETAELEAHLATCATCARRAAAMRTDASMLGRPLTLQPSRRVDDAIYAEIARRQARPGRLVLVAAAALLVLALLGAAAIGAQLLRTLPALPITLVPPVSDPVAVTSPRPDASRVPVGVTWGTIDFEAGSGGSIEAVAFAGGDLVGVGGAECVPAGEAPTQCYAGAWTARPGERWVRQPNQSGLELGPAVATSSPQAGIFDAAAGRAGTVAIGYADDGNARVWRSTDGRTWQRTELDRGSSAVLLRLATIETSPAGFVIVGWAVDTETSRARAAAWTSPDGVAWTRAEDTADMDVGLCFEESDGPSCGGMTGVVATPSGFVAVGSDHARAAGTEPGRPAAWTSPDGLTWTQANTGLDFVGALSDVEVGGSGLIAVGSICPPECHSPLAGAVAATSVDGSTWSFRKVDGAVGGQQLATVDGRVFALGVLKRDTDQAAELELWQTADGVAWQRVTAMPPTTDAYGGADIEAANGRLVIVGWQSVTGVDGVRNFAYASPPVAAPTVTLPAWTGLAFQGGAPRGSMIAVSPTASGFVAVGGSVCDPPDAEPSTCQASIWTAAVGDPWSSVPDQPSLDVSIDGPFTGPDPGAFDVAAGPAGIVAIGNALDQAASTAAGSTMVGSAIWRSADGRTWQRIELGSPPIAAHLAAIAADAQRYVIVGWVDDYEQRDAGAPIRGRAAAWTSPDGISWTRATDTAAMDIGPCRDAGATASCGGMHGVSATSGGFVAVGHARTADSLDGRLRPAAWTSPDGLTWTRADSGLDFGGSDGYLTGVTAGGFGVVAVGSVCPATCDVATIDANAGIGVAAESVDGSSWRVTSIPAAVGFKHVVSVVITDETRKVFAVGWGQDRSNTSASPPDVLQLWFSNKAGDWAPAELPPIGDGFAVFGGADIATGSDRLVLVGGISRYTDGAPLGLDGLGAFSYSSH